MAIGLLASGPSPAQIESDRLAKVMRQHNVFSAKSLDVLARHQCEAISSHGELTEWDLDGRNFLQRLRLLRIDPKRTRCTEIYFKSYHKEWLIQINGEFLTVVEHIEREIKQEKWTHYGLAVEESYGIFYIVFTFADLRTFA
jgi:hypothetical protein